MARTSCGQDEDGGTHRSLRTGADTSTVRRAPTAASAGPAPSRACDNSGGYFTPVGYARYLCDFARRVYK